MSSGASNIIGLLPVHEVPVPRDPGEGLLADRERIAEHLTNTTVQQIFRASLELHSALGRLHPTQQGVAEHIRAAVHELDATLCDLRRTVFDGTNTDNARRQAMPQ